MKLLQRQKLGIVLFVIIFIAGVYWVSVDKPFIKLTAQAPQPQVIDTEPANPKPQILEVARQTLRKINRNNTINKIKYKGQEIELETVNGAKIFCLQGECALIRRNEDSIGIVSDDNARNILKQKAKEGGP